MFYDADARTASLRMLDERVPTNLMYLQIGTSIPRQRSPTGAEAGGPVLLSRASEQGVHGHEFYHVMAPEERRGVLRLAVPLTALYGRSSSSVFG